MYKVNKCHSAQRLTTDRRFPYINYLGTDDVI